MSRDKVIPIGDDEFIITKFDALTALKLKGQIIAILAPAMGNAMTTLQVQNAVGLSSERMGMQLLQAMPLLDMDKATDMIVRLCETARYGSGDSKGNMVVFVEAFDDDLMPAYELAIEICKFNFEKYVKALSQGTAQA